MNTYSDENIIQHILKGNQEMFRVIIERYQGHLYAMGMRFFKNHDDASDFSQEVFVKVYNNLYSYKGAAAFKGWLMKIGYNHAINTLHSIQKNDSDEYHDNCPDNNDPMDILLRNELCKVLEEAINDLPPAYKACVDLYFYLGLSMKEISNITGYPVNTIKSHVYRAKKQLYSHLKGTIAEEYNEM